VVRLAVYMFERRIPWVQQFLHAERLSKIIFERMSLLRATAHLPSSFGMSFGEMRRSYCGIEAIGVLGRVCVPINLVSYCILHSAWSFFADCWYYILLYCLFTRLLVCICLLRADIYPSMIFEQYVSNDCIRCRGFCSVIP
jgi:hypothetical protein